MENQEEKGNVMMNEPLKFTETGGAYQMPPLKKYRCPNGHETEPPGGSANIVFSQGREVRTIPVCIICLADFLEKNIPLMTEVVERDEPQH